MASQTLARETRKPRKTTPQKAASAQKASPQNQPPFKALMVMEASTGKVLEEINPHLKHPLASVTKLMLASVVMEKLQSGAIQLTEIVTTSAESARMGGSQVYLKEGERFTLEEMMKAVMIASGNDAAHAVAEHISGTQEAFAEEMNKKAQKLGMNDSEFHSAHGLPPGPGQSEDISSCHDLVLLARDLLNYPKLLEWTAVRSEPFRDGAFIMHNHNKIIAKLPGTDGFKTGFYSKAGFNVVATAQKDGLRLIVVVLGGPSAKIRDAVAIEKFKKYMAKYRMAALVKKGQDLGDAVSLPDGETQSIQAVTASDFSYPVIKEKIADIKKEIHLPKEIEGGVEAGQKLGEIVFMLEKEMLGKVDLISPARIGEAGFFTKVLRRVGFD
jgi:D-alanyl-D-alanine carboxypeptidase (penicillin-binding protein 5/6)